MHKFEVALSCARGEGVDVWDLRSGSHLRSVNIPVYVEGNDARFYASLLGMFTHSFPSSVGSTVQAVDDEHLLLPVTDGNKAGVAVLNWKTGQVVIQSLS